MQIETEEEVLRANDRRRDQVMMPERDVMSRPKRPASAADVKLPGVRPSPSSAGYRYDADVMSSHSHQSNKENVSRPTKLRVSAYAVYWLMLAIFSLVPFLHVLLLVVVAAAAATTTTQDDVYAAFCCENAPSSSAEEHRAVGSGCQPSH